MKAYQPTQVVVVTKATCQEKKVIFAMLSIPLATVLIGLLPTGEKFTVSQLVGVTLIVMPQVPTQLVYILPVILGYTKLILMVPLLTLLSQILNINSVDALHKPSKWKLTQPNVLPITQLTCN